MGGKRASGGATETSRAATTKSASRQLSLPPLDTRVLAAEVHPSRHAPETWPTLVDRLVELGVTHVATLLPWTEIEPRPGEIELGARRPAMAFGEFLDLVADRSLRAIVRVGPRVRADLALAGLPEHVVHDRAVMARSARGNPVPSPMPPRMFPWPSYASTAYRDHVRRFFAAVAEVVAPRLAPRGIVDAIEIEDPSAVVLRAGVYARDYHADAIALFRGFLAGRYESPCDLAAAWGIAETSFDEASPPTRFSAGAPRDLPRHLDWAAFQEWLVDDFRGFIRDALDHAGLESAVLSSSLDASAIGLPTNAAAASARLDRVGVELATRAGELDALRRRLSPITTAAHRPFARVLLGGSPWGRPRRDEDTTASALLAVAFGARELELTMAVAHERWWGAPIDTDGAKTATFDAIATLVRALDDLGIGSLARRHDTLVVVPPEYARFVRVTHLFGPLGAGLLDFAGRSFAEATLDATFGFARPIQHAFLDRLAALETALDEAHLDFAFTDPASAVALDPPPRLAFVPSFEAMDESTSSALATLAARGTAVVLGPDRPRLGRKMDPVDSGLDALDLLADATHAELVARIAAAAADASVATLPHDPASAARAYPLRRGGAVVAYVVANPGESCGEILLPELDPAWLDPLADETFRANAAVPAPARSARLVVPHAPRPESRRPKAAR